MSQQSKMASSTTWRVSVLHALPVFARVYRQCIGAHLAVRLLASTARRNTHRHILTTFVGSRRHFSTDASTTASPKTPIRTLLAEETVQGRIVYVEEQLQEIRTTLGEAHQVRDKKSFYCHSHVRLCDRTMALLL